MSDNKQLGTASVNYLFTGHVDTADGVKVTGKLDTVRDAIVFTEDPNDPTKFIAMQTDERGALCVIKPEPTADEHDPGSALRGLTDISSPRSFVIPPLDLVNNSYVAYGTDWQGKLVETMQQSMQGKSLESMVDKLPRRKVRLQDMREPLKKGDVQYKSWYEEQEALKRNGLIPHLNGFVLPSARAVFFAFNDPFFKGAKVSVWLPGEDYSKDDATKATDVSESNGLYVSVLWEPGLQLPEGEYTIKVVFNADKASKSKWSGKALKDKFYMFRECVTFPIKNSAANFDVIFCDPISVEETMIMQFPNQYSHLISYSKEYDARNKAKVKNEHKVNQLPTGLEVWNKRSKYVKEKTELLASLSEVDGRKKLAASIGKSLWQAVETSENNPMLMKAVDFAFGVKATEGAWFDANKKIDKALIYLFENDKAKLKKRIDLIDNAEDAISFFSTTTIKKLGTIDNKLLKIISTRLVDTSDHIMGFIKYADKKTIGRVSINQLAKNAKNLQTTVKSLAKKFEKPLIISYHVDSIAETSQQIAKTLSSHSNNLYELEQSLIKYHNLAGSEKSVEGGSKVEFDYVPCRANIEIILKKHALTIASELKFNEELLLLTAKLFDAAVDAVAMYPGAGQVIKGIALAKDAVAGVIKASQDLILLFDNAFLSNVFAESNRQSMLLRQFSHQSIANQILLFDVCTDEKSKDKPETNLNIQFRLRAEAFYGLIGLLTRAAMKATDEEPYEAMVEKYKIMQYIQNYILNDQWVLPRSPAIPIRLDAHWLFIIGGTDTSPAVLKTRGLDENYHLIATDVDRVKAARITHNEAVSSRIDINYSASITSPLNLQGAWLGFMHYLALPSSEDVSPLDIQAKFQDCFPVHHFGSKDIKDFANGFATIHTELDKHCLAYTAIHYRERGCAGKNNWKPVYDRFNDELLDKGQSWFDDAVESIMGERDALPLSPKHQLRVLIVLQDENLKGQKLNGIYPIQIQLMRYDNISVVSDVLNIFPVAGPVYKGIVKPLAETELLPEELKYKGKLGIVINPYYQLGELVIPGAKPMATECGMDISKITTSDSNNNVAIAQEYYENGGLTNMRYGFEVTVGKKKDTAQHVRLKCSWEKQGDDLVASSLENEFFVSVDTKREYRFKPAPDSKPYLEGDKSTHKDDLVAQDDALLLTKNFLLDRSSDFTFPQIFDGAQNIAVLMRLVYKDKAGRTKRTGYLYPHPLFADEASKVKINGRYGEITAEIKNKRVHIHNFDWNVQLEFTVILSCETIHKESYEHLENVGVGRWNTVPMSMQMFANPPNMWSDIWSDYFPGPMLPSTKLQYCGSLEEERTGSVNEFLRRKNSVVNYVNTPTFKPPRRGYRGVNEILGADRFDSPQHNEKVLPLLGLLSTDDVLRSPEARRVSVSNDLNIKNELFKREIFIGRFMPQYESPGGRIIHSIRPFGEGRMNNDNDYELTFQGISTPRDTGLKISRAASSFTGLLDRYVFSAPKDYTNGVPWVASVKGEKPPNEQRITDWIEKESTKLRLGRKG